MGNLQTKKTRSKALFKKTPSYAHNCNNCENCQKNIQNNKGNECGACQFIFFENFYKNFSSGDKVVDELIKNPIYFPPTEYSYSKVNYYEWIPWEHLSNIIEIARGGFGIIYKSTLINGLINVESIKHHGSMEYERKGLGMEVAIKIIKNSSEVFKELNIQRVMFSKNGDLFFISSFYGITQNVETLEYGIVMEFAKYGDMRKYLSTNFHSKSWKDKLIIVLSLVEGLKNIHSSGMIHCDLHSGNILQLSTYNVNIGDLGLSQPTNNEATTTTKEKKIFGVIPYIPPEVLRGENFTKKGDIYSFSMLLWELATGKPPFHDLPHDHILIMAILNGQRPKITSPLIPPCIAEIIVKCWDPNPKNRPTTEEIEENLLEIWGMYEQFRAKKSRDETSTDQNFTNEKSTGKVSIIDESKTVGLQFLESEKYVKEMVENDSTTSYSTAITTIHPGAIYTSRLLTLQMVDFSEGWFI
ncbi:hypothetical protein G9A89_006009 [Geosiphon pyriformis]|nr:hypothetical protein G9A89_006009 [Geosiphon pyriformis]